MPRSMPTGSQELALLRHIALHGPSSVGRVAETFGAEHGLARSTVLTVMERLRRKGHLGRRRVKGLYVYASTLDHAGVLRGAVGQFVERALQGSVSPIAAWLTAQDEVSESELRELQAAVEALRTRKKGGTR
jgi:predicted transcriptional regulator